MIHLLSYEALEMPIGKGCLYTVGVKFGGVTGYAHARLGADGGFSVPDCVPRETTGTPDATQLGRWYSQGIVQYLGTLKRESADTLVQHMSEAVTAAVAERDPRVRKAKPIVDDANQKKPRATGGSDWWGDPIPRRPKGRTQQTVDAEMLQDLLDELDEELDQDLADLWNEPP